MNRAKDRLRMLCLAAVVILVVSGMCFAGVQADSLLECHRTSSRTSLVVSGDFTRSASISAEEASGLRTVSSALLRTRQILVRSCVKAGAVLILLIYLLADFHFFTGFQIPDRRKSPYGRLVIVRYIHSQDGRKG